MDDLIKALDGSVDDAKARLAGKSHDDLLKLQTAETDNKKRKGVLDALSDALTAADSARTGGKVQNAATIGTLAVAAALDTSGPADVAAAETFSPSGAPHQSTDFDPSNAAVDNDPRAGTTAFQNRIDFNDPTLSGQEAVERALKTNG